VLNYKKLQIFLISLFALSIALIFLNNPYVYNYDAYEANHYVYALVTTLTICLVYIWKVTNLNKCYIIDQIDILLFAILIWNLLSRYWSDFKGPYLNEIIISVLVIASLYVLAKHLLNIKHLVYGFTSILAFQVIYVFYQLIRYYKWNNLHLALTGTLGNSGLISGFVIFLSPVIVFLLNKKKPYFTYAFFLLITIFLFLTQSRSALLALFPTVYFSTKRIVIPFVRKLPIWSSIVILAISITFLFLIKVNSALGRLLIWKITLVNSFQSAIIGVGFGGFPKAYQLGQMEYFVLSRNNLNQLKAIDLPNNCFNEPLQIFFETGLIGVGLWAYLAYTVCNLIKKLSPVLRKMFSSMFISFFIFSLFSYPLHSLPILTAFVISLALLSKYSKGSQTFKLLRSQQISILVLFLVFAMLSFKYLFLKNQALNDWSSIKNLKKSRKELFVAQYAVLYPYLRDNGRFLLDYGTELFMDKQYKKSLQVLKESSNLLVEIDPYLQQGQVFEKLQDLEEAENIYYYCMQNFPLKLKPQYCLLQLYLLQKDSINAYRLSKKMIDAPVKNHSPEVFEMLRFASKTLFLINSENKSK